MSRFVIVSALLVATVSTACSDRRPPPQTGRFDRPNRVALLCVLDNEPHPPEACGDSTFLHALVTQSARGEVAAVDLRPRGRGIIDARQDIPGFTFTPVGELPIAIQVPRRNPGVTYVANLASRDVYVLDTAALLSLRQSTTPVRQIVSLEGAQTGLDSAAGPVDMLLTPDEDALVLALPDSGSLAYLPIADDGMLRADELRALPLAKPSELAAAAAAPAEEDAASYERLCSFERPTPPAAVPVEPSPAELEPDPRPVALALDAFCREDEEGCVRRLLVADESLPLLHVLDLDALADPMADATLPPVPVGTATTDVVVTPRVPVSVERDAGETQYVYAIDANDGSVLVVEDGRVLNVNADPAGRPDRLPLDVRPGFGAPAAVALEIATPRFDPAGEAGQWVMELDAEQRAAAGDASEGEDICIDPDDPLASVERLRGVFLAVAAADGSVRIVDVHDTELLECDARQCGDASVPRLLRHHPRLGPFLFAARELTTRPSATQLQFRAEGVALNVRNDGTTGSPDAPGLACIACGDAAVQIHPDPELSAELAEQSEQVDEEPAPAMQSSAGAGGDQQVGPTPTAPVFRACPLEQPALVCAIEDPWRGVEEPWIATYEGVIPGTRGGRGRFVASDAGGIELTTAAEAHFCVAGVLGARDIEPPPGAEGVTPRGDQLVVLTAVLDEPLLEQLLIESCEDPNADQGGCDLDDTLRDCATLREALDAEDPPLIAFPILQAHDQRLVLEDRLVERVDGLPATHTLISACMGGDAKGGGAAGLPLRYEVRTRDSFTVIGGNSGFAHTVEKAAEDSRCVLPPDRDPMQTARAYPGVTFRNRVIEVQLRAPDPDDDRPWVRGVDLVVAIASPARKLTLDLTAVGVSGSPVIPVFMRYSDVNRTLYLVDIHSLGLVPIRLDAFPERATEAYN